MPHARSMKTITTEPRWGRRRLGLVVALLFALLSPALAQGRGAATVTASLSSGVVRTGETVSVTVGVEGSQNA